MPNSNVIEIVLSAVDYASSVIAGVKGAFKEAEAAAKKSGTETKKSSDLASEALNKLKSLAATIGVGVGIKQVFGTFIEEAGASEMAAVRLDLAYKNLGIRTGQTRKELDDFAKSTQRASIYTDEAVAGMQETLFRFGTLTGDMFTRTQSTVVDFAAAMQTDLSSAAQMLGRALEDPARGMMVLRRSGIILSDSQKTLIKDFLATGETAKAQAVILDELDKRFKGTAETVAGTMTGSIDQLKIAYKDLFESTKEGVSAFAELTKAMTQTLQDPAIKIAFNALFALFTEMVRVIGGAIQGWALLGAAIIDALTPDVYSKELVAAWDTQAASVKELNLALADLALAKDKAAKSGQTGPDQVFNVRGGTVQKTITQLKADVETAQRNVATAQSNVNEQVRLDPTTRRIAGDAAKEGAAKDAALAAQRIQEDTLKREQAIADARVASVASLKEASKLAEAVTTDFNSSINSLNESTKPVIDAATQYDEIFSNVRDHQAGLIDRFREAQTQTKDSVQEVIDKYGVLILAVEQYMDMLRKQPEDETSKKRIEDAQKTVAALGVARDAEVKDAKDALNKQTEFSLQAARNMQSAFADFLFDPFKGGLRGMVKGFSDTIRRMIAEAAAAKIFEKLGIKDQIDSLLNSVLGIGGTTPEKPTLTSVAATAVAGETPAAGVPATTVPTTGTNPFAGFLVGIKSIFGEAISGMMGFISPLLSGLKSVFGPFLSAIGKTFSGVISGIGKALGALSAGAAFSGGGFWKTAIGLIGMAAFGAASGGIIPANKPTLVGENGPEVIIPTTQAQVINKRQLPYLDPKVKNTIDDSMINAVNKTKKNNVTSSALKNAAEAISDITNTKNSYVSNNKNVIDVKTRTDASKVINKAIIEVKKMPLLATTTPKTSMGGSAGGGIIPGGAARLVGENGPEIIVPTAQSNIVNARQMAFAGNRSSNVNYNPSNTVVIQGGNDSKETESRMLALMAYNNEQQMKAIVGMMYNNGLGRMR
ncbi:Bacteriophage lambda, GpH, tail tape measure, N-terminal [uncultured Caudovirales phage]|uniref:Bacteriophage lambda, GpH, tail tape measure, N-terminal n=1 Tax=uncultured Caudovirales phage TaxID=2100421 RepID=A0A6J5QG04_9CAUD|nr:Bacteriophage lambda, GpH, tail tape measure, N-terminal [uncultured Caudovirales phage]CAB4176617.1 Bacteriophage lambda, GpH, tail tape measure, N-terminal [uncultured Caudovirales phage]CAB4183429.1 Bacteriophage lambda, GpH, tail tape measure, N-terminal [uncultured Caudovirales phage]CAB4197528.1 Bacteriophage lambda, GpH, tail tape measure, N-terminal [uncultured Caudovirales phage]CAB4212895.1 Bacteriophage lambda, GpH, tail tape measure, N-terminal [uncultured Caudovirales phage]